jgi:hypothetical protein
VLHRAPQVLTGRIRTRRRDHEHLDNFVRYSVDRLAGRLHGVPRGRWTHSLAADLRSYFVDPALRVRPTRRVRQADAQENLASAG